MKKDRKRKASDVAFGPNRLPKTRRAQFFDILKHKFGLLTQVGSTIFISSIPLIIALLFESIFLLGISNSPEYVTNGVLNETGYTLFITNKIIFY